MVDTVDVACAQFNISGAGETILAVENLPDVFSPPHHGPRNIPISVKLLSASEYSYTHFPIVRTGKYAVYLGTAGVFDGLIYGGVNQAPPPPSGTPIATEATSITSCSQFAEGFVSSNEIIFNQNDPQPIAIRLKNGSHGGQIISYIVTLFS